MEERPYNPKILLPLGLLAILVSIAMLVMGLLHAGPLDGEKGPDGVLRQNCTVLEDCGCPGEPMIPWYLIVGGCLTIVLVLGRFIWQLVSARPKRVYSNLLLSYKLVSYTTIFRR